MKLSNAERAFVDVRKLHDYCLSTEHPRGQHKARVFKRALGWTTAEAGELRSRLLQAVQTEEAVFLGADDYGQRYALDFHAQGAGQRPCGVCGSSVTGRTFHDSPRVMSFRREHTS